MPENDTRDNGTGVLFAKLGGHEDTKCSIGGGGRQHMIKIGCY